MNLLNALEKTMENYVDKYHDVNALFRGDCPLCKFFNDNCEGCIVQKECSALFYYAYIGENRTLFGEIVDARDKLQSLISTAILHLDALIEKEKGKQ